MCRESDGGCGIMNWRVVRFGSRETSHAKENPAEKGPQGAWATHQAQERRTLVDSSRPRAENWGGTKHRDAMGGREIAAHVLRPTEVGKGASDQQRRVFGIRLTRVVRGRGNSVHPSANQEDL